MPRNANTVGHLHGAAYRPGVTIKLPNAGLPTSGESSSLSTRLGDSATKKKKKLGTGKTVKLTKKKQNSLAGTADSSRVAHTATVKAGTEFTWGSAENGGNGGTAAIKTPSTYGKQDNTGSRAKTKGSGGVPMNQQSPASQNSAAKPDQIVSDEEVAIIMTDIEESIKYAMFDRAMEVIATARQAFMSRVSIADMEMQDKLEVSLMQGGLNPRFAGILAANGIVTFYDALVQPQSYFLGLKSFGPRGVEALVSTVKKHGPWEAMQGVSGKCN
jgi:hypothetical protein